MRLNRFSESSAQPGLSVSKLLGLPLAIPPTEAEQLAIATALSDVDALLGGTGPAHRQEARPQTGRHATAPDRPDPPPRLSWRMANEAAWEMRSIPTRRTLVPTHATTSAFKSRWRTRSLSNAAFCGATLSRSLLRRSIPCPTQAQTERYPRSQRSAQGDSAIAPPQSDVTTGVLDSRLHRIYCVNEGRQCREAIAHPPFVFSQMIHRMAVQPDSIDALLTGSNYPAINQR